jgi:hypothetical protein
MAMPLLAMDLNLDLGPRWRDNRTGWGAWIFGTRFMETNRARYLDAFFAARLVVLALGIGLGVLLFQRARRLLSPLAAIAVLVLYATTPTVIAHSAVATLDVGVTMLLFATFVAAERFAATKAWDAALLAGLLFGVAFAVKGVAALFAPLLPVLVALGWGAWDGAGIRRLVVGGAVMAAGAWIALLAAYGFSGFPLPGPLVDGVRFQLAASSAGEYPAFLNGQWSPKGWWYYYVVAFVLKTPLPTLVLLLAGIAVVTRRRLRDPADRWLVIPPLFLLYVLSFHYGKNYGVRYLLPAFPFFLLLAGRGVDAVLGAGRRGAVAVGVLLAWQLASCAAAGPEQLAYFNELAGGPEKARRLLLDSNLDWGQDLGRLKAYLDARGTNRVCLGYFGHVDPQVYGIDFELAPPTPTPGLCAVSANFLAGYPYAITYAGERILSVRPRLWSWFDDYRRSPASAARSRLRRDRRRHRRATGGRTLGGAMSVGVRVAIALAATLVVAEGVVRALGHMLRRDTVVARDAGEAIYCLGDSFTYGQGVRPEESWPQVLGRLLRAGAPPVRTLAEPGCSSSSVVVAELANVLKRGDARLVLVLTGWNANDGDFAAWAEERRGRGARRALLGGARLDAPPAAARGRRAPRRQPLARRVPRRDTGPGAGAGRRLDGRDRAHVRLQRPPRRADGLKQPEALKVKDGGGAPACWRRRPRAVGLLVEERPLADPGGAVVLGMQSSSSLDVSMISGPNWLFRWTPIRFTCFGAPGFVL